MAKGLLVGIHNHLISNKIKNRQLTSKLIKPLKRISHKIIKSLQYKKVPT